MLGTGLVRPYKAGTCPNTPGTGLELARSYKAWNWHGTGLEGLIKLRTCLESLLWKFSKEFRGASATVPTLPSFWGLTFHH